MAHYLLKWNPRNWTEAQFLDFYYSYLAGQSLRWSCGGTKRIIEGDRFFLLKTGLEPRGIIGAGYITSPPEEGEHYDPDKADLGKTALYVGVHFEHLAHPGDPIPIARAELDQPHLASTVWNAQGSGKQIPAETAAALEVIWVNRLGRSVFSVPDEVSPRRGGYPEGAVRPILVNAYERNAEARAKCIEHWGVRCQVCGFNFESAYGHRGKGYIHVHHVVPISEVGQLYLVDPINDLRPVCANCHAMIHRGSDPMSLTELKKLIKHNRE